MPEIPGAQIEKVEGTNQVIQQSQIVSEGPTDVYRLLDGDSDNEREKQQPQEGFEEFLPAAASTYYAYRPHLDTENPDNKRPRLSSGDNELGRILKKQGESFRQLDDNSENEDSGSEQQLIRSICKEQSRQEFLLQQLGLLQQGITKEGGAVSGEDIDAVNNIINTELDNLQQQRQQVEEQQILRQTQAENNYIRLVPK